MGQGRALKLLAPRPYWMVWELQEGGSPMRMFILVFTLLLSLGLLDWGLRTAPAGVAEADEAPRAGSAPSAR